MSIQDARSFITKMRGDRNFRKIALAAKGPEDLSTFLQEEDLHFNQRELVGAMAECMEQSELQMIG